MLGQSTWIEEPKGIQSDIQHSPVLCWLPETAASCITIGIPNLDLETSDCLHLPVEYSLKPTSGGRLFARVDQYVTYGSARPLLNLGIT